MKGKKVNKFFVLLVICGALLFGVIAFIVMKATATVTAIVPNQYLSAGTKIEESMITAIQVPANTPEGFITDKTSIVGQKMKVAADENQLLYVNDFMSSWDSFSDANIPDDYVITSLKIPSDRAVGGMITAGDTVDILGVPNSSYQTTTKDTMANYLGDISKNSYGADGINVYWVLSNVKILETDSTLSSSNDSSISTVTQDDNSGSSDGSYYIVALSYDDYKKVRLAENYLDFWMSIAPEVNNQDGSNLDLMGESVIKELEDSQKQSKVEVKESTSEDADKGKNDTTEPSKPKNNNEE